jgi:hypothetical protein
MVTLTVLSTKSNLLQATTDAQLPVPQASVAPAPLSQVLTIICFLFLTSQKLTLVPFENKFSIKTA